MGPAQAPPCAPAAWPAHAKRWLLFLTSRPLCPHPAAAATVPTPSKPTARAASSTPAKRVRKPPKKAAQPASPSVDPTDVDGGGCTGLPPSCPVGVARSCLACMAATPAAAPHRPAAPDATPYCTRSAHSAGRPNQPTQAHYFVCFCRVQSPWWSSVRPRTRPRRASPSRPASPRPRPPTLRTCPPPSSPRARAVSTPRTF